MSKINSRILFVLESFYPNIGGVENLFLLLAQQLVKEGFHIEVITSRQNNLKKFENYHGIDITRVWCPSRYLFPILALPRTVFSAFKFDVLHTTSYAAAFPAWVATKIANKKSVITFHEYWGNLWFKLPFISKFSAGLFFAIEKIIARLSFDKFIAVSEATADSLRNAGVIEKKMAVIHNGLDYQALSESSQRFRFGKEAKKDSLPFTFLFFGRLGVSKGLDILLPAMKLLSERSQYVKLKIVASRDDHSILGWIEKYVKSNGLENRIEILPPLEREELLKTIVGADCVVFPSYSEGFCFGVVESSALGVPVIISNKGSLPEVVSGKYLIFDKMDSESLCDAMRKACHGEWNEKPLIKFDILEMVGKYIRRYERF